MIIVIIEIIEMIIVLIVILFHFFFNAFKYFFLRKMIVNISNNTIGYILINPNLIKFLIIVSI